VDSKNIVLGVDEQILMHASRKYLERERYVKGRQALKAMVGG
jgi:hypothetical protein